MNIFITSPDPIQCAVALDDRRVIKMALESTQMLSTVIHIHHGSHRQEVYRPTHAHHPCTVWTAQNRSNAEWLYAHMVALQEEYRYRFGKIHKTTTLLDVIHESLTECLPEGEFSTPPNCTVSSALGVDFSDISDVYEAYRRYLKAKWQHDKLPPKWSKRQPPKWYSV